MWKALLLSAVMTMSCSSRPLSRPYESRPTYVLAYPDMPRHGIRPIDANGIISGAHGIHPCALPFLKREFKKADLPTSQLNRVRFFNSDDNVDAINDLAFSKGFRAITRDDYIYVGPPTVSSMSYEDGEEVFFHELVHTAQFQSGDLSLSSYALSSMQSFASGQGPHDNRYEDQASTLAVKLLHRWKSSRDRRGCYADDRKDPAERRIGKRSDVIVMFAVWDRKQGQYIPRSMQF